MKKILELTSTEVAGVILMHARKVADSNGLDMHVHDLKAIVDVGVFRFEYETANHQREIESARNGVQANEREDGQ